MCGVYLTSCLPPVLKLEPDLLESNNISLQLIQWTSHVSILTTALSNGVVGAILTLAFSGW